MRRFTADANVSVMQDDEQGKTVGDVESENARIGIDTTFSSEKHAYVLTFPWNYPEIIENFEAQHTTLPNSSFWSNWIVNSCAVVDFNNLFRDFHQSCALPDKIGIFKTCEGRLAQTVFDSVQRIHFHGLDIEMANLTVVQPNIQVLKVEIAHGLSLERNANGDLANYNTVESTVLGAPATYYTRADESKDCFDGIQDGEKPYCLAVTALIESPMKLYVQN